MTIKFVNFFKSKIADVGGIGSGDTEATLSAGDGANLPTLTGGHHCYLTFVDVSSNREIVKVTGVASDTITMVRGQDGTTPRAFAQNDLVELRLTKGSLEDIQAQIDAAISGLLQTGNVMLFGGASAPTGWTKKTDWTTGSMLMFTTGTPGSGGSDNPASWTTALVVQNENGHVHAGPSHNHATQDHTLTISQIPDHLHGVNGNPGGGGTGTYRALSGNSNTVTEGDTLGIQGSCGGPHNHGNTGAGGTGNTGAGSAHAHTLTQDTFTPKYQEVIAATRN